MALSTLTNRERQWQEIAQAAMERNEEWEKCEECLRFHPEGFDGDCADPLTRLPKAPATLVG